MRINIMKLHFCLCIFIQFYTYNCSLICVHIFKYKISENSCTGIVYVVINISVALHDAIILDIFDSLTYN